MELNVKFDLPFEWCTLCNTFTPRNGCAFTSESEVIDHDLPSCYNDTICKAMAAAHDKFLDIMREEQKNGDN